MLLHGIIVKGKQNNSTLSNLTSTLNTYRQSEGRSVGHTAGFRTATNNNREFTLGYRGRWEVSRGLSANRIAVWLFVGARLAVHFRGGRSVIGGIVTEGRRETVD